MLPQASFFPLLLSSPQIDPLLKEALLGLSQALLKGSSCFEITSKEELSSLQEKIEAHPLLNKNLLLDKSALFFRSHALMEEKIAEHLAKRRKKEATDSLVKKDPPSFFTDAQKKAYSTLFEAKFLLLTGGPGSGKTFTLSEYIAKKSEECPEKTFLLSAPTGKAAFHLHQSVKKKYDSPQIFSETLHKALLDRSSVRKLPYNHVIVDEASMLDLPLFYRLVEALREDAQLVLVGDPYQLPAVGMGAILETLVRLNKFLEHVHLDVCKRAENAEMQECYRLILEGNVEAFIDFLNSRPKSVVWEQDAGAFLPFKSRQYASSVILTPLNKGPLGTERINQQVLRSLIFSQKNEQSILDIPILVTQNREEVGLYNGSVARIRAPISAVRRHMDSFEGIRFEEGVYWVQGEELKDARELPYIVPAYAMTIHKAQGSEFSEVWIPLSDMEGISHALLYTACTRAKEKITLFATEELLYKIFSQNIKRESRLYEKFFAHMEL